MKNPFSGILKSKKESVPVNNTQLLRFQQLSRPETDVNNLSVVNKFLKDQQSERNASRGNVSGGSGGSYDSTRDYHDFVYSPVLTNKVTRINSYQSMAKYPEVDNAIDEICNAMVNEDDSGSLVNIKINNFGTLTSSEIQSIQNEFEYFIGLFDFDDDMYDIARQLVTEGECAWEHIIDPINPKQGLLGVRYIPTNSYEALINLETFEKEGIFVFDNPSSSAFDGFNDLFTGANSKNELSSSNSPYDSEIGVPLPFPQITYVNTGNFDSTKMICYPVLETARSSYKKLTLIEDAILIYRLVRAPERLVFNVNTGNLPKMRAEAEVQDMMKRYQTKQFYDSETGEVSNGYDAFQFLESYWFPKPEGSGGTEVSSI